MLPASQSIVSYRGLLRSHPGQTIEQQVRNGGERTRVYSLVFGRDSNQNQVRQSASTGRTSPITHATGCVSADSRGHRCSALVRVFGLWNKVNSHRLKNATDVIANIATVHQTSALPDVAIDPSATQIRRLSHMGGEV